jgi:hypothetical protein
MWTVVYIASNRQLAERLKLNLSEEGLLANIRLVGANQNTDIGVFEILVPESEAEEATEIINQQLTN